MAEGRRNDFVTFITTAGKFLALTDWWLDPKNSLPDELLTLLSPLSMELERFLKGKTIFGVEFEGTEFSYTRLLFDSTVCRWPYVSLAEDVVREYVEKMEAINDVIKCAAVLVR